MGPRGNVKPLGPALLAALLVLGLGLSQSGAVRGSAGAHQLWRGNFRELLESPTRPQPLDIVGFAGTTWRGWGTSLAWFANFVGGLPPAQLAYMMDKLFDIRKGLGLNIVRYNIPGGIDPSRSRLLRTQRFQTAPYGFRPRAGGPYTWTADLPQRRVLVGAVQRGAVAEAISYSPPSWMTISGDVSGNPDGGKPNITPNNYQAFATYLADVLAHFKAAWKIKFVGLNPFNEPLDRWWKGNGTQEGCAFAPADMPQFYDLLRSALDARGLQDTPLQGLDDWALASRGVLKQVPAIWSRLDRVTFHGYRFPTYAYYSSRTGLNDFFKLGQLARTHGKEIWQTEWGPWGTVPESPSDLDLGLIIARTIAEQVNLGGLSAWLFWQAVVPLQPYYRSAFSPNDGLIRMHFDYEAPFAPQITKQYYVQMHFTRFVRPGSKILRVSSNFGRLALAAYNPTSKSLAVVVVNQQFTSNVLALGRTRGVQVRTVAGRPMGLQLRVYRTSAGEDFNLVYRKDMGPSFASLGTFKLSPRSVTSFVIYNAVVV